MQEATAEPRLIDRPLELSIEFLERHAKKTWADFEGLLPGAKIDLWIEPQPGAQYMIARAWSWKVRGRGDKRLAARIREVQIAAVRQINIGPATYLSTADLEDDYYRVKIADGEATRVAAPVEFAAFSNKAFAYPMLVTIENANDEPIGGQVTLWGEEMPVQPLGTPFFPTSTPCR